MKLPREASQTGQAAAGRSSSRTAVGLPFLLVCAMAAMLAVLTGCTRSFYQRSADNEVLSLYCEKNQYPQWELFDANVYPYPMARFYDPSNPNRPPMPPDDPAAWLLSPKPQHPHRVCYIEGTGYIALLEQWDQENRARLREKRKAEQAEEKKNEQLSEEDVPQGLGRAAAMALGQACLTPAEVVANQGAVCLDPKKPFLPPDQITRPAQVLVTQRTVPYLITLDQAIELGVINSRDYQLRREGLYLAALPVTLQRFNFTPQFLANQEAIREWAAKDSQVGKQNRWSINSTVGVSQRFATGALLMFQIANRTVINLTGGKHTISTSILDLDVIQPFLQGGGLAVTLEDLTESERRFLYTLRDFARFHRTFFVNIAAGDNLLTVGDNSEGIEITLPGRPAPIGYYRCLLQLTALQNAEQNVEAFSRLYQFMKGYAEGGAVSRLQVDQVEQNLLDARARVITNRTIYQDALDQFKIQLGLPTELPITLDEGPLESLREQLRKYEKIERDYNDLVAEMEKLAAPAKELRTLLHQTVEKAPLLRGTKSQKNVIQRWESWARLRTQPDRPAILLMNLASSALLAPAKAQAFPPTLVAAIQESLLLYRLAALRQEYETLLDERGKFVGDEKPVPPELEAKIRAIRLDIDTGALELSLQLFEREPWLREASPERQAIVRGDLFRRVTYNFALVLQDARRERLEDLEKSWPKLPPVCLHGKNLLETDESEAQYLLEQTALMNRLDLMNVRAAVVDRWREIAVAANSLMGVFDVRYHMDVLTPPSPLAQPLDFGGVRSRNTLALNTELPLVRLAQRNNYRRILIDYQRSRRALQLAEDAVLFQVRQEYRQLLQFAENYRIRQRAIVLAYLQVDNAFEVFRAPPEPGFARDAASAAASLTQQLVNAQNSVPREQDNLFQAYVNFVTTRMRLYRDLELMRTDSRGVWIDEFASSDCAVPARCSEPPPWP